MKKNPISINYIKKPYDWLEFAPQGQRILGKNNHRLSRILRKPPGALAPIISFLSARRQKGGLPRIITKFLSFLIRDNPFNQCKSVGFVINNISMR